MAQQDHDIDPFKVSSPRIFLVRMMLFLVLGALLIVVLYKQIWAAFLANPGLNGLIVLVLLIGIVFAFRQVLRLFPEVAWVNSFRLADPGLAVERPPTLLAPMQAILRDRMGRMAISPQTFDALKEGLGAPLGGMGISFSSSLFGLAGSLILGFLDLQTSQAQNRF